MNSKSILIFLTVWGLVQVSCFKAPEQSEIEKPNIILIMSDDHGWFDVGFNGNSEIKTTNMDALAAKGAILDRFYAASAVCSPTRASVLTGRNPLRINIPYANRGHLKKEEITIPELLKNYGYVSGHFGKWHLGTLTTTELDANRGGKEKYIGDYTIPTEHGYDMYFCTESKVPTYNPMIRPTSFMEGESKKYGWRATQKKDSVTNFGTAYWEGENLKVTENIEGDDSKIIIDRVIPFIQEANQNSHPFFTTIWFHTPHLPVVSNTEQSALYSEMGLQKQLYYGAITAMDEQIGRLWKELEKLNLSDNTILVYLSDNGPEVETPGSAGIFREKKRSLYEGGVRVPAFAIWPKHIKPGRRVDFPMVTSDFLPTILEILNDRYPDHRPLDGINIMDAINGKITVREKPIGFICEPQMSWVSHQYKLIGDSNGENFELYDVLDDKSEQRNIIQEKPAIANQMKKELFQWLASVEFSKKGGDYTD